MDAAAQYLNLPFSEAIAYFRDKLNMPTETWDELWKEAHTRAFTVAGATSEALLEDLRTEIDKAISEGTTLEDFRKAFDEIVQRAGWSYFGSRGWRTAVIYDTNLTVAYSAGRWKQMTSPAVQAVRPYLRYMPSSSAQRRKEHQRWYNLILPADHDFWKTHYPPNGWGCKCGVMSVSRIGLERLQREEAGSEFPIRTTAPTINMVEHVNKRTGVVTTVPEGIDPGWDYNVGIEAWPDQPSA